MTFKDRPVQVGRVSPTGLLVLPLAMLLGPIATRLYGVLVPTMWTERALRPAQVANDFEAFGIADEVLSFQQLRAGRAHHLAAVLSQVLPKRAYGIPWGSFRVRPTSPPPAPTWNP